MIREDLSIIIPVGRNETELVHLLKDLQSIEGKPEIISVYAGEPNKKHSNITIVKSKAGRAHQLNAGAKRARGKYLWFLHADSRIDNYTLNGVRSAICNAPDSLSYFNLHFIPHRYNKRYFINEWGVRFRSRLLGTPFGDQGFIISKDNFVQCGQFPEQIPYGEDHLFVWKARQSGIPLHSLRQYLYTSSRKYSEKGWLNVMMEHQKIWIKQAIPELFFLLQLRGVI